MSTTTGVEEDKAVMAEVSCFQPNQTAIINRGTSYRNKQPFLPYPVKDPTARAYINGNYVLGNTGVTADNWTEGVWGQFDSSLGTVPEAEKQAMKMADYQPFKLDQSHG